MSKPASELAPTGEHQFPCKQCGANLQFAPGTTSLKCPYCGAINEIPELAASQPVQELDINQYFRDCCSEDQMAEQVTVKCTTCGAETTLAPNVTADRCPFCGSGIVAEGSSRKIIKPQSLLPFYVTKDQAAASFMNWISGLWFAPSELARRAEAAQIAGVYIPCWTYDANTRSDYTGERGDDYTETETYTEIEDGKPVTRTRQVTRTRWTSVSAEVANTFDDILILATRSLPPKLAQKLEPWDLKDLVPYQDEYLSGFVAESYQIGLPEGFEEAKQVMVGTIQQTVNEDIGGDHQRISSLDTQYFDVTFKHALLPVWISAYRYGATTYRFLVNARTGEVQGERPYSTIKILLLIFTVIAILTMILIIMANSR